MKLFLAAFVGWFGLLPLAAAPSISRITPNAVVPGRKTVLSFSGTGLSAATNLWTSFAGVARRLESSDGDSVSFEVACPETASGSHALQMSGPEGASDYKLVLIDSLRVQPNNAPHHSPTNALVLISPIAVDGVAQPETVDYYAFHGKAGETVSIEALAHRIGSDMDPVVRILDADGRELAFCDDEPGVRRDARLGFTIPTNGDYRIAVHDSAFGGGSKYGYRLRFTREPLTWFAYPLADPADAGPTVEALGSAPLRKDRSPADPLVVSGLGTVPAIADLEPNNVPAEAQALFIPALIHGKIESGGDLDHFRFSVQKGEKLIVQSQTRSLGSPCDLVLSINSLDGKRITASNSGTPGDAALTNEFSEAGEFLLEIRELSGNTFPKVPYRVKADRFKSGIEASTDNHRLEARPGDSVSVKLSFSRYDYSGPITLEIEPPIEGLGLENPTVPEKKNEFELKLKVSAELKPGDLKHFKIRAKTAPQTPAILVRTDGALRKSFPLMLNPPRVLRDLFSLAIKAK